MIKLTILLRRNPELSHEEFIDHYRDRHATLIRSSPVVRETVRRIVQQYPIEVPEGLPPTSFDGVTELWFDSTEAMAALFTDPSYLEQIRPDEARFCDVPRCEFILSTENVVLPLPEGAAAGDPTSSEKRPTGNRP